MPILSRRRFVRPPDPITHNALLTEAAHSRNPQSLGVLADHLEEEGMPGAVSAREAFHNSQDPEQVSHPFRPHDWWEGRPGYTWVTEAGGDAQDGDGPYRNVMPADQVTVGVNHSRTGRGILTFGHRGRPSQDGFGSDTGIAYSVPVESVEHLGHLISDLPAPQQRAIRDHLAPHLRSDADESPYETNWRGREQAPGRPAPLDPDTTDEHGRPNRLSRRAAVLRFAAPGPYRVPAAKLVNAAAAPTDRVRWQAPKGGTFQAAHAPDLPKSLVGSKLAVVLHEIKDRIAKHDPVLKKLAASALGGYLYHKGSDLYTHIRNRLLNLSPGGDREVTEAESIRTRGLKPQFVSKAAPPIPEPDQERALELARSFNWHRIGPALELDHHVGRYIDSIASDRLKSANAKYRAAHNLFGLGRGADEAKRAAFHAGLAAHLKKAGFKPGETAEPLVMKSLRRLGEGEEAVERLTNASHKTPVRVTAPPVRAWTASSGAKSGARPNPRAVAAQFRRRFTRNENGVKIEPSQGDGYKITTPHGYIDYRHNPGENSNEIWWVESHKKGHGSELVDLMQQHHPAGAIGWGVTTTSGKTLRDKWHAAHPEVGQYNGAFEGQFDPSGNNYGEGDEEDEHDFDDEDDLPDDDEPDQLSRRPDRPTRYATRPVAGLTYGSHPYGKYDLEHHNAANMERGAVLHALHGLGIVPPIRRGQNPQEHLSHAEKILDRYRTLAQRHIEENPSDPLTSFYRAALSQYAQPGSASRTAGAMVGAANRGARHEMNVVGLSAGVKPLLKKLAYERGELPYEHVPEGMAPRPPLGPDSLLEPEANYGPSDTGHTADEFRIPSGFVDLASHPGPGAAPGRVTPASETEGDNGTDLRLQTPSRRVVRNPALPPAERGKVYTAIANHLANAKPGGPTVPQMLQERHGFTPEQANRHYTNFLKLRTRPTGTRTAPPPMTPKGGRVTRRKFARDPATDFESLLAPDYDNPGPYGPYGRFTRGGRPMKFSRVPELLAELRDHPEDKSLRGVTADAIDDEAGRETVLGRTLRTHAGDVAVQPNGLAVTEAPGTRVVSITGLAGRYQRWQPAVYEARRRGAGHISWHRLHLTGSPTYGSSVTKPMIAHAINIAKQHGVEFRRDIRHGQGATRLVDLDGHKPYEPELVPAVAPPIDPATTDEFGEPVHLSRRKFARAPAEGVNGFASGANGEFGGDAANSVTHGAFADFLDDHDDPRAAVVRRSNQYAAHPSGYGQAMLTHRLQLARESMASRAPLGDPVQLQTGDETRHQYRPLYSGRLNTVPPVGYLHAIFASQADHDNHQAAHSGFLTPEEHARVLTEFPVQHEPGAEPPHRMSRRKFAAAWRAPAGGMLEAHPLPNIEGEPSVSVYLERGGGQFATNEQGYFMTHASTKPVTNPPTRRRGSKPADTGPPSPAPRGGTVPATQGETLPQTQGSPAIRSGRTAPLPSRATRLAAIRAKWRKLNTL